LFNNQETSHSKPVCRLMAKASRCTCGDGLETPEMGSIMFNICCGNAKQIELKYTI
jgi:hypothetical protein